MLEAKFACFSTNCKIKSDAPRAKIDAAVAACAKIQARWNFYSPKSALFRRNFCGEKMPLDADEIAILRALLPMLDNHFCPHKAACWALRKRADFWQRLGVSPAGADGAPDEATGQAASEIIAEGVARKCLAAGKILDFGGVMKEAAADLCAQILRGHFYVINFGGDLRTSAPIKVLIKNPANPRLPAACVEAAGALCTSACYERGEHIAGERNDTASATVVAPPAEFAALACGVLSTKMLIAKAQICPPFGALRIDAAGRMSALGQISFVACE